MIFDQDFGGPVGNIAQFVIRPCRVFVMQHGIVAETGFAHPIEQLDTRSHPVRIGLQDGQGIEIEFWPLVRWRQIVRREGIDMGRRSARKMLAHDPILPPLRLPLLPPPTALRRR